MKKLFFFLFLCFLTIQTTYSQNDIKISREFKLFTNQNAQGYVKPLFTTLGQSFNTSLMNTSYVVNDWSFGLDISAMGMFIPSSQLSFDAVLPNYGDSNVTDIAYLKNGNIVRNQSIGRTISEPTIYGGISTPVFAAPQNFVHPDSTYKTVAFMEGNNISFMSGLPVLQLVVGIPTRTQLRLRFLTFPIDNVNFLYFGGGINQNIDRLFDLFGPDSPTSLSLTGAYTIVKRDPGIDINSYAAGLNISHKLDFGLTLFGGVQYEGLSGTLKARRDNEGETKPIDSPYQEIREGKDLLIDVNTFTNYRIMGGVSFELGPIEIHADAAYASQPQINLGATIWFYKPEELNYDFDPFGPPSTIKSKLLVANNYELPKSKIATNDLVMHQDKNFKLDGNISVFGKFNGLEYPLDKIRIEEFLSRQMKPLMPYVFFSDNSSEIPSRYNVFTSSADVRKFDYTALLGKSTLESYYDILNIYGKRLTDNPGANITLIGYKSAKGSEAKNKNISRLRVEKIRDYFVNIWQIDPARIKVQSGGVPKKASNEKDPLGSEENRRVEILVDNWEVTRPVDLQDTLRKVMPDKIIFRPKVESDFGIANWTINVKEGEKTLKQFSGNTNPANEYVWDFAFDPNAPRIKNDLYYNMQLKDKDGQQVNTVPKSIPVELVSIESKRKNATKDTIINIYNLILFDFNKSTLDPTNKRITDVIKSEIPPNAIVKVIGYTDIIGKEDYNLKLSTARAKTTKDALQFPNATFVGKGESELLYDNSTPEGRYYCRTVVVEVRIPVN